MRKMISKWGIIFARYIAGLYTIHGKVRYQGKVWYSDINFGDEFMKIVFDNYKDPHKFGNFYVYSPS